MGRILAVLVTLAVIAALAGCSLLAVKRPDDSAPATVEPRCTSSAVFPGIDVVIAAASLTGFAVAAASGDHIPKDTFTLIPFGLGFAASAAYGIMAITDCRRAKADHRRTVATP